MLPSLPPADVLITAFDHGLRTLLVPARSIRPHPDDGLPQPALTPAEAQHAAGLMRVNHVGEVCAQALYHGQALTARSPATRGALEQAAQEEVEHLAWTARRLQELGSHTSRLNPLWYAGSLTLGLAAGLLGDKVNLGFLAETERQVADHLQGHLQRLPAHDERSRAIVAQMHQDESAHAATAVTQGALDFPGPVRQVMRSMATIMTTLSYRL
jgi:ubiquinone biosynthesis monooxygenase Coq7